MVRHQAALASGKLTRVTSGVNLPPPEVIMSRRQEAIRIAHAVWIPTLFGRKRADMLVKQG